MSRALDENVKEALRNGNHTEVFDQIAAVLTSSPVTDLLEIELLGQSHILDANKAFIQDGSAIAIPKLRLVQAFIIARQIFNKHSRAQNPSLDHDLLRATAVMLMFDPEHLTAANTRKRIIQRKLADRKDAESCLLREKHLIDSLLTSRLHRHTKSPTLWSHRRWLIKQITAYGLTVDVEDDLRRIIMVSGERHARNYYAWCHARLLTNAYVTASESLSIMIIDTKSWCFSHHNDISGWQFLLFLLQRHECDILPVFRETLGLVESFKWRNESVWYFLRHVARTSASRDIDAAELVRVKAMLYETASVGSRDRETLDQAMRWAGLHQQSKPE